LNVSEGVVESPGYKCQIDPEHRSTRRQLHHSVSLFLGELEDVAMKLPHMAQCRVLVGFAANGTVGKIMRETVALASVS